MKIIPTYSELFKYIKRDGIWREVFTLYEELFNITPDMPWHEHPFYKDYLSKFNIDWQSVRPADCQSVDDEEWDMLQRLIVASCCCTYAFDSSYGVKKLVDGRSEIKLIIVIKEKNGEIHEFPLDECWSYSLHKACKDFLKEMIERTCTTHFDYCYYDDNELPVQEMKLARYEEWREKLRNIRIP